MLLEEKIENSEKKNHLSYDILVKGNDEKLGKLQEKLLVQVNEIQKEKNDFINSFMMTYKQFHNEFEKVKKGKHFSLLT
jgi:hypothetical protein